MSADVMPRRSVPDLGAGGRRAMTSQQAAPAKSVAQDQIGPRIKTDSSELCKNFAACCPSRNLGETSGGKNTNKQTNKKARPPLLNHMGATSHGMALLMG